MESATASQAPNSPPLDSHHPKEYRPLRIWIPVILLVLMGLSKFVADWVEDGPAMIWMVPAFGPLLGGLGIILWWLMFSRARWTERLVGFIGIILVITIVVLLMHPTMLGAPVTVITVPLGITGFAIGSILFARILAFKRTLLCLVAAFVGAGFTLTLQNFGTRGDFSFEFDWRWNTSPEEQFLAEQADRINNDTVDSTIEAEELIDPPWPGFRGPNRDGVQAHTTIPEGGPQGLEELWRIKVGPGWSSFAATKNLLFTQEQRGDTECVVCYRAGTGQEVWSSSIASRFFEALGGLGPRATPTLHDGKIYALGAEGNLRCLDAVNGNEIWMQDLRTVAQAPTPMWGFSSSPLVAKGLVAVHAGGSGDNGVVAFDTSTGDVRWKARSGKMSYGSLQLLRVAEKNYFAILSDEGAQFFEPETGTIKLDYRWQHSGYRALQPQLIDGNKLLIPTGMGSGTRLVELSEKDDNLDGEEIWTSRDMKSDFNDLVVYDGNLYGFDSQIFACISGETGERQWKAGRYGKGQVLLLKDRGLLLVATEKGGLVLLRATPEEHEEIINIQAFSGKTWNHPIVIDNRIYMRNAEEAVCYQIQ